MKKKVAGLINQKITIYRFEDVKNSSGGSDPFESVYWETSAEVRLLKASSKLEDNQTKLNPVAIFKLRYRDDKTVIPDMILYWRGQKFEVIDVEIDYVYKEYINIKAKSGELPTQ